MVVDVVGELEELLPEVGVLVGDDPTGDREPPRGFPDEGDGNGANGELPGEFDGDPEVDEVA